MITIDNKSDQEKKNYFLVIVITVLAVIIIVALVIVYYWVLTDSAPQQIKNYFLPKIEKTELPVKEPLDSVKVKQEEPEKKPEIPEILTTKIIKYVFPVTLPADSKSGNCVAGSIAQPFRQDAFRCTIENSIYDPCFANDQKDKVVCQMNPLSAGVFIINLTQPLPAITLPQDIKSNWAWFLELEDGTICSPYTGTKPLINNEMAVYGCKPKVRGNLDVLIGDLVSGQTWTAKRMIVVKDGVGTGWDTKFSGQVNIKTIWQ